MEREAGSVTENRMGTESIGRLLLKMSGPAMLSMFVHALYNIFDSIFVAHLSEKALSAVSMVLPIQFLMIAFGVGTGIGLNSLISRRLGARRYDEANAAAGSGILLGIINGIIFAIVGLFASEPFLRLFTDDQIAIQYGLDYMRIVLLFSVFSMISIPVEKILQAEGNMKDPMKLIIVGAVVNTILDPILIYGMFGMPRLEIAGAAIATVIAQFISFALGIYYLRKKKGQLDVTFGRQSFDLGTIKEIYAVGAPSIIMQSLNAVVLVGINAILASFSLLAVAVMGVYGKIQSFVFMPVFGINQGALPIMGYNYGAKQYGRMKETYKIATIAAMTLMAVGFIIVQLFPEVLLSLFDAKGEMMVMGKQALRAISICFIPAGFGIVSAALFQATGHGFYSMWGTIIRQFAGILPLAYIFGKMGGLSMVWWSYPAAEVLGVVYYVVAMRHLFKNKFIDDGETDEE